MQAPARLAHKLEGRIWLQAFEPCSYAGLQVWFSAYLNNGRLVYAGNQPEEVAERICKEGVEVISATPSWWRRLLQTWPTSLPYPQLLQASLGGERVDQDILDAVSKHFNPKGLTHLYATTEAGMILAVKDRKAGFPARWIEDKTRTPTLRLDEHHILHVTLPDGKTVRTGDIIEIIGERAFFAGREDDIINIGGRKIGSGSVESAMLNTGLFADVRVYARSNPITGQLMAADIVCRPGETPLAIAEVKQRLRSSLAGHMVPQVIRWVPQIEMTANGKKSRI
ncbi:MAG: hypothetical protein LR015_04505 [Verrucomicrobia bacterium]|nr:hypothetical protein [Verrucomicrobiota bacterium]